LRGLFGDIEVVCPDVARKRIHPLQMLAVAPGCAVCIAYGPAGVCVGQRVVLEHDDSRDQIKVAAMQAREQRRQIALHGGFVLDLRERAGRLARRAAIGRETAVAFHVDH